MRYTIIPELTISFTGSSSTATRGKPKDMASVNSQVSFRFKYLMTASSCSRHDYIDHETALSAVRNLNNVEIGGRPLRIDIADSDPFLEGKTTVRGEILDDRPYDRAHRDGGYGYRENYRDRDRDGGRDGGHGRISSRTDPNAFLSSLPPGVPVPPGATSLDAISRALATMNPAQLIEVLAQMKVILYR
jgi:cleavage stimulation factor subunit 2